MGPAVYVLCAITGRYLGPVRDAEMLAHVKQYPDEFVVWERRPLRRR